MTLSELAITYRASAAALRQRAELLEHQRADTANEAERLRLEARVRILYAMWRETRDLAVLCEHYYDRGYRRNAKYTI